MSNYQTIKIGSDPTIQVTEHKQHIVVSPKIENRIEALWQEEKKRCGERLFNGQVLTLTHYSSTQLSGEFVPYRYALAQYRDPTLYQHLNLHHASVSGLTRSQGQILIGKRASNVLQYPDCFECVPSGSIDPSSIQQGNVHLNQQLLTELQEEAGIHATDVGPFLFIYDPHTHFYEFCATITLPQPIPPSPPHDEYRSLHWATPTEIHAKAQSFVPLSLYLLDHL